MSKTYTITDKQISSLHNGMCEIRSMMEAFEHMFKHDSLINQRLIRAFNYIEPVRKELMDKKDADFDRIFKMAQKVAELNGFKNSIWSIYEIESFDDKSNVPAGSKIRSQYSGNEFTETVEGPTWLDAWKAVDKLVAKTTEYHGDHVFVEGFHKAEDGVYEVSLGS